MNDVMVHCGVHVLAADLRIHGGQAINEINRLRVFLIVFLNINVPLAHSLGILGPLEDGWQMDLLFLHVRI